MAGDEQEDEMNWVGGEVESKEAPASVDCTKFRHRSAACHHMGNTSQSRSMYIRACGRSNSVL
jgi:hypothetical protein